MPTVTDQELSDNPVPIVIEHDFFAFFAGVISSVKHNQHYDPTDGILLGIETTPTPPPDPAIVPKPRVKLGSGGASRTHL